MLIYVSKRFGKLFGNPLLISPGFVALIPLIGFLVVVSAPASMLVGCILLAGMHLTRAGEYLPTIARWGVPLIAGILASLSLVIPVVENAPAIALHLMALVVLFAYGFSGSLLPSRLAPVSISVLAAALPLLAAPFFGAPSYIAIDILILAGVLLGANMAAVGSASAGIARQPFGLLLGWLAVNAATHGAWIPAVISLLVYGGALVREFTRTTTELEAHAP